MKRYFLTIIIVSLIACPISVLAQSIGDLPNIGDSIGNGNTGNTNTGNTGNTGSSTGTSTVPDTGMTLETTELPEFSGFRPLEPGTFVGVDLDVPFVGTDPQPNRSNSSTGSQATQNSRSTTSSSRRTTASRMTSSRTTAGGRMGTSTTSGNRTVRAATTTDFDFVPTKPDHRLVDFKTQLTRLPNLQVIPKQIDIQFDNTPTGNIATLSGTVSSERERRVIKQLLLLQPGIDKVENKLAVSTESH
ncbi:MAG: BON domain-containing protein [Planctomycetaceae bacterium]|jgi:hypothetical protein|nr:BON domain-containing protein [Planctomycetaceae bacterium]